MQAQRVHPFSGRPLLRRWLRLSRSAPARQISASERPVAARKGPARSWGRPFDQARQGRLRASAHTAFSTTSICAFTPARSSRLSVAAAAARAPAAPSRRPRRAKCRPYSRGEYSDDDQGARRIMFQEPRLLPWARVVDNVGVGLGADGYAAERLDRARTRSIGSGFRTRHASGRRLFRAASASAWRSPARWSAGRSFLALDEPLGALDALTRIDMQALHRGGLAGQRLHRRSRHARRRRGGGARRPHPRHRGGPHRPRSRGRRAAAAPPRRRRRSRPWRAASSTISSAIASSHRRRAQTSKPHHTLSMESTHDSSERRRRPTSSGSCRPTATGAISARARAAARCSLAYLKQIAQAADDLGYFGVLLPTGRSCEDSWVVASALAPLTRPLALSGRRAPRAAGAGRGSPHGRDPRPDLRRAPPHQRRDRRRSGRAERRRRLPRP